MFRLPTFFVVAVVVIIGLWASFSNVSSDASPQLVAKSAEQPVASTVQNEPVAPPDQPENFPCWYPARQERRIDFDSDGDSELVELCDSGGSMGNTDFTISRSNGTKIIDQAGIAPVFEDVNKDGYKDITVSHRADMEILCEIEGECFNGNSWRYRKIYYFWQNSTKTFGPEVKGNWEN